MRQRPGAGSLAAIAIVAAMAAGCTTEETPSPTPTGSPTAVATATASPTAETAVPTATSTASPSPTAEPSLALDPPADRDERRVEVDVSVDLPPGEDGRIVVTVTSLADSMIDELVLRWPEALHETLFPAPFVPSDDRIREGGPPLRQEWTKWVIGPGERGEPAGTVSLGYGPLPAGGTLEIPLFVTRRADGSVAFDLQVLAGEALLELDDGNPAELRVEAP